MDAENRRRIEDLRDRIDSVDQEILERLNERAQIAIEIGRIKSAMSLDPYDPGRENEILERLRRLNRGPFPEESLLSVYREIMGGCLQLERESIIAYLGPPGSFCQLACISRFGSSIKAVPMESVDEIFDAVEKDKVWAGVVPIENSTEGTLDRTLDLFIESGAKISGEIFLKISHSIFSRSGERDRIAKILSHPQALGQCRQWLKKNFPNVPKIETSSTAAAARMASEDETAAAIASSHAGRLYGLRLIEASIEDNPHNHTRFLILSRKGVGRTGSDKTSLLFSIPHVPGSLYKVLKVFFEEAINLTKIESRPMKAHPWEYVFFVDFEGHLEDRNVSRAIDSLRGKTAFMKILGSYPRGI